MEKSEKYYRQAEKRVYVKLGFYMHLAVYVGVMALLIFTNLSVSPQNLWFKWPLVGWGIGIFFHGVAAFLLVGGESLKERMIEKEMKQMLNRE